MMSLRTFKLTKKPIDDRFFAGISKTAVSRLLVGISLLFSITVVADELVELPILTLDRAVELTLRQHPQLGVFTHRRDGYQGLIEAAGVGVRPSIDLVVEDFSGDGDHSGFDNAQATLSISWVMQQTRIEGRIRAAQAFANQVEFQQEIMALDLSAQTARLFIQALVEEQRLVLAGRAAKQAKKTVAVINKRANAGKSSEFERLQAEVELAQRELEAEDLEHELKATRYQLSAQWGDGRKLYSLDGELFKLPSIANIDQQFEIIKKNPALALVATQQRIVQSEIELARIEAKPQWQFSVGVRRFQATDDFGLVAGVSVPLGKDASSTGKIRSLRARQAEYDSDSVAFTRRLETQIYVLLQEMKHSEHVIDTLQTRIIPALDKAQVHATRAYDTGRLGYQQWNAIVHNNLEAQHNLLNAFAAIHLQHIELQRLTGASLTL